MNARGGLRSSQVLSGGIERVMRRHLVIQERRDMRDSIWKLGYSLWDFTLGVLDLVKAVLHLDLIASVVVGIVIAWIIIQAMRFVAHWVWLSYFE